MSKLYNINARFCLRGDTKENWKNANPILALNEPGYVTDGENGEFLKFGDGETPWNQLEFVKFPKGDKGDAAVTDITYMPFSDNAQSGKAVAQAVLEVKEYTNNAIGNISSFETDSNGGEGYSDISALPATGQSGVIYLVVNPDTEDSNRFIECIWVGDRYEKVGVFGDVDTSKFAQLTNNLDETLLIGRGNIVGNSGISGETVRRLIEALQVSESNGINVYSVTAQYLTALHGLRMGDITLYADNDLNRISFVNGGYPAILGYIADPVADTDAVNKRYLEENAAGLALVEVPWSAEIVVPVNKEVKPITLLGDTTLTLAEGAENKANEWRFSISQGETAYGVTLPEVKWTLGIAPVFLANTITEIILYYVGNELRGVWNE